MFSQQKMQMFELFYKKKYENISIVQPTKDGTCSIVYTTKGARIILQKMFELFRQQ